MFEGGGDAQGSRWFDNDSFALPEFLDSVADFRVGDGGEFVDEFLADLKRKFAGNRDGSAIAKSIKQANGLSLATGDGNSHAVLVDCFDADNFGVGGKAFEH